MAAAMDLFTSRSPSMTCDRRALGDAVLRSVRPRVAPDLERLEKAVLRFYDRLICQTVKSKPKPISANENAHAIT